MAANSSSYLPFANVASRATSATGDEVSPGSAAWAWAPWSAPITYPEPCEPDNAAHAGIHVHEVMYCKGHASWSHRRRTAGRSVPFQPDISRLNSMLGCYITLSPDPSRTPQIPAHSAPGASSCRTRKSPKQRAIAHNCRVFKHLTRCGTPTRSLRHPDAPLRVGGRPSARRLALQILSAPGDTSVARRPRSVRRGAGINCPGNGDLWARSVREMTRWAGPNTRSTGPCGLRCVRLCHARPAAEPCRGAIDTLRALCEQEAWDSTCLHVGAGARLHGPVEQAPSSPCPGSTTQVLTQQASAACRSLIKP